MASTFTIRRHPIRAAVYGVLLGLSAAIYLLLFSVIRFGEWVPLAVVVAAGLVIGVVWAYLAPPRKPKVSRTLDGERGRQPDVAVADAADRATTGVDQPAMPAAEVDQTPGDPRQTVISPPAPGVAGPDPSAGAPSVAPESPLTTGDDADTESL